MQKQNENENENHVHKLVLRDGTRLTTGPAIYGSDGESQTHLASTTIPAAKMLGHVSATLTAFEEAVAARSHYSTVLGRMVVDDPPLAPEPATKSAPGGLVWSTTIGAFIPAADRNAFYVPHRRRIT